jgi:hypothetical protein
MYEVIKVTKGQVELISKHKQEQAATNKCRKLTGSGFSECWGVTYQVIKISDFVA